MPSTRLKLSQEDRLRNTHLPPLLRTRQGTVLIEIQGQINIDADPLFRGELDARLPSETVDAPTPAQIRALIGDLDLSHLETSYNVLLEVGESQRLRGVLAKLSAPLCLIDVSQAPGSETRAVDIVTHKLVFTKRPEPVLKQ